MPATSQNRKLREFSLAKGPHKRCLIWKTYTCHLLSLLCCCQVSGMVIVLQLVPSWCSHDIVPYSACMQFYLQHDLPRPSENSSPFNQGSPCYQNFYRWIFLQVQFCITLQTSKLPGFKWAFWEAVNAFGNPSAKMSYHVLLTMSHYNIDNRYW